MADRPGCHLEDLTWLGRSAVCERRNMLVIRVAFLNLFSRDSFIILFDYAGISGINVFKPWKQGLIKTPAQSPPPKKTPRPPLAILRQEVTMSMAIDTLAVSIYTESDMTKRSTGFHAHKACPACVSCLHYCNFALCDTSDKYKIFRSVSRPRFYLPIPVLIAYKIPCSPDLVVR
jgi:hypothetical protein